MKRKLLKRFPRYKQDDLVEELETTEREFGELLSTKWDVVKADPQLQKKALMGAKRIKELRLMLVTHKLLQRTVQ